MIPFQNIPMGPDPAAPARMHPLKRRKLYRRLRRAKRTSKYWNAVAAQACTRNTVRLVSPCGTEQTDPCTRDEARLARRHYDGYKGWRIVPLSRAGVC